MKFGNTHVLCTALLNDKPPMPWRLGAAGVTAEYSCCRAPPYPHPPRIGVRANNPAGPRKFSAWIGRSAARRHQSSALGERQITVDCDIIQADGGTCTARITGAWAPRIDCLKRDARPLDHQGQPVKGPSSLQSLRRVYKGVTVLDPTTTRIRRRDRRHFVITGKGGLVEIQMTAENETFDEKQLPRRWRWVKRASPVLPTCSRAARSPRWGRRFPGKIVNRHTHTGSCAKCASFYGIEAVSAGELGPAGARGNRRDFR